MTWLQRSLDVAARFLALHLSGLSTPRSDRVHLCTRLGPATRRSGAYPDKTCTC